MPPSYVVADKMKLSKDKTSLRVNDSLVLEGIPEIKTAGREDLARPTKPRQPLRPGMGLDQYRVTEDERSGIKSDSNREDGSFNT